MELGIIILLLGFIGLFSFLTFYLEEGLRPIFMLLTMLMVVVSLAVIGNLATAAGIVTSVVSIIWVGYYVALIGFLCMFFYVLIKLITALKIREIPRPRFKTPMQEAKERRRMRTGRY